MELTHSLALHYATMRAMYTEYGVRSVLGIPSGGARRTSATKGVFSEMELTMYIFIMCSVLRIASRTEMVSVGDWV